ncbi:hypothetical protein ACFVWG_37725 [Kribbella sp. NPDC058245]|uniref:hypothetical protein n=1 Tax=Kribbella sp. NPDC058245 TaxID=3346399 RepID=UPI0036E7EB49
MRTQAITAKSARAAVRCGLHHGLLRHGLLRQGFEGLGFADQTSAVAVTPAGLRTGD